MAPEIQDVLRREFDRLRVDSWEGALLALLVLYIACRQLVFRDGCLIFGPSRNHDVKPFTLSAYSHLLPLRTTSFAQGNNKGIREWI